MSKRGDRRTDLEALEVLYPDKYINMNLIPTIVVPNRTGDLFFIGVTTAGTAVVDRTEGTALSNRIIGDVTSDYTCALVEDRASVPFRYSDEHGLEFADRAGARSAKKTIMKKHEEDAADLHLGTGTPVDVVATHNGSMIEAIDANREALYQIAGETVLTMNWSAFRSLTRTAEVQDRLKYTGVINQDGVIVRGIRKDILMQIFDVDRIEVGRDDLWNLTAGYDLKACLSRVPVGNTLSLEQLLEDPYFCSRFQLNPGDGATEYLLRSWDENNTKLHQYDVESYSILKTLNSIGKVLFDNITS